MEYEELQSRLRKEIPGTSIGFQNGTPVVVSYSTKLSELRSATKNIDPNYEGGFAYAPGRALFLNPRMTWLDNLESKTEAA